MLIKICSVDNVGGDSYETIEIVAATYMKEGLVFLSLPFSTNCLDLIGVEDRDLYEIYLCRVDKWIKLEYQS